MNTYVVNMTAYHRAGLTGFLFSGNSALTERQSGLAQSLVSQGYGAAQAHTTALTIIDNLVNTQAQTMAYNNAFVLIGIAFVFAFPVILLLKRPKPGATPPPLH